MKTNALFRKSTAFIARPPWRLYLRLGMVRLFSSLFVALALFMSPLAMAGGAGMATPHAVAAASAAGGHCAGSETPSEEGEPSLDMSCASSCAAYPPPDLRPAEKQGIPRAIHILAKPQLLAGIHLEGETPPPRITPEI